MVDIEKSIVGSMINDSASFQFVVQKISNSDAFSDREARLIFQAAYDGYMKHGVVDPISIKNMLHLTKKFNEVKMYFTDCLDYNLPIQVLEIRVDELINIALYSNLENITTAIKEDVKVRSLSPAEISAKFTEMLGKVSGFGNNNSTKTFGQVLSALKTKIDNFEAGVPSQSIPTGFPCLDEFMQLDPGDLITIAGRAGMGKSAFALAIAGNLAIDQKVPTGFISMEMPNDTNAMRMVSSRSGLKFSMINHGYYGQEAQKKFYHVVNQLGSAPLYMDDDSYVDNNNIRSKVIYMATVLGCKVIFLDYLGLVDLMPYIRETRQTKADAIGYLTKSLKRLAQKLGVTIIELHQISRSVEGSTRPNYRPILSDLKDSGSVEEDSVKVILLYRPEYYADPNEECRDGDGRDLRNMIEAIIAKNRNGKVGRCYFEHTKMSNIREHEDFNKNPPTGQDSKKRK